MAKLSIKQARLNELPRIRYVTKLAYKAPYKEKSLITKAHESTEETKKFQQKEIFILTTTIDNKIIGAVRYKLNKPSSLYFFKLAVLKTYRSLGVGGALINQLEKVAKKKKCKKLLLDCAQEKKLDEYYKKLGFKIDRIENKINYHIIYMSKNI